MEDSALRVRDTCSCGYATNSMTYTRKGRGSKVRNRGCRNSLEEVIRQLVTLGGTVNKSFGNTKFFEENYLPLAFLAKWPAQKRAKSNDSYHFSLVEERKTKKKNKEQTKEVASCDSSDERNFQCNFLPIAGKKYIMLQLNFRDCPESPKESEKFLERLSNNTYPLKSSQSDSVTSAMSATDDVFELDNSDDYVNITRQGDADVVNDDLSLELNSTESEFLNLRDSDIPTEDDTEDSECYNEILVVIDKKPISDDALPPVACVSVVETFIIGAPRRKSTTCSAERAQHHSAFSKKHLSIVMKSSGEVPTDADISDYLSCKAFKLNSPLT